MTGSGAANGPIQVIACEVLRAEMELAGQGLDLEPVFLEQALHHQPQRLARLVQRAVDQAPAGEGPLRLAFGLCSNGLDAVRARDRGVVAPRCHDCVSLFLGSRETYQRRFAARPGTIYLSFGWLKAGQDPLSKLENQYLPRLGAGNAEWALRQELKNYTHLALIDTGAGDMAVLRRRAQENCRFFGLEYQEIAGDLGYLRRLLLGGDDGPEFLRLAPGQEIEQKMYF